MVALGTAALPDRVEVVKRHQVSRDGVWQLRASRPIDVSSRFVAEAEGPRGEESEFDHRGSDAVIFATCLIHHR